MGTVQTSGAGRPDGTTEQVLVALRRIVRAIDLRSRHLVMLHGVTGPQLVVMKELARSGGCCVSELTKAVHLGQATATGILDRLEKRGLVRRQRSDRDRRRVLARLTDTGRELLADAPPLLQEEFTAGFAKLEQWERTQILSSLQRVVAMMEAKGLDATPIPATGPVAAGSDRTKAFLGDKPHKPDGGPPPPPAGPREAIQAGAAGPCRRGEGEEAPS